ncbi:hypothetical protein [Ensifer soli]|uniref:hypothetical protein n=1 Tax=Ciceribacter sp. sgz301302 TaxID=3342379 RepID=UPI0035B6DBCE
MRSRHLVVTALLGLILTGCTAMTEPQYEAFQTALEGSPGLRREAVRQCMTENWSTWPKNRPMMAKLMNVSPERARNTFCQRMTGAIASKRLTYGDVVRIWRGSPTPNAIRVLQGR